MVASHLRAEAKRQYLCTFCRATIYDLNNVARSKLKLYKVGPQKEGRIQADFLSPSTLYNFQIL